MSYLTDFLYYTSGNECPEPYRIWSALSLLAAVAGRKVWTWHGRYPIRPALYVVLVGDAGSGKSTAKNEAKRIFVANFPDQLISASFQSHQDIIDQMCNAQPTVWEERDAQGELIKINGYTSFYIVCNEFASILSTDKKGMVEFLVDIFEEDDFSTGYKGMRTTNPNRKQSVSNPYVNILACAVPQWFMSNLKLDLFDGGLGRRLIIVYCDKTECIPHPMMPMGGEEAKARVVEHLKYVSEIKGEIKRSLDSHNWWTHWYTEHRKKPKTDPILTQFDQTRHIYLLKIALLLSLCDKPFGGQIEVRHLETAKVLLEANDAPIAKLTAGIGRNELAGVGVQLLDMVQRMGGAVSEKHVKKFFNRYMNTPEFKEVLQHYSDTGELYTVLVDTPSGIPERVMMLPDNYQQHQKKLEIQRKMFLENMQKQKGAS